MADFRNIVVGIEAVPLPILPATIFGTDTLHGPFHGAYDGCPIGAVAAADHPSSLIQMMAAGGETANIRMSIDGDDVQ